MDIGAWIALSVGIVTLGGYLGITTTSIRRNVVEGYRSEIAELTRRIERLHRAHQNCRRDLDSARRLLQWQTQNMVLRDGATRVPPIVRWSSDDNDDDSES